MGIRQNGMVNLTESLGYEPGLPAQLGLDRRLERSSVAASTDSTMLVELTDPSGPFGRLGATMSSFRKSRDDSSLQRRPVHRLTGGS